MIKGILFDFGYVIAYPANNIDRKFLYLNWNGIDAILQDKTLSTKMHSGISHLDLESFFFKEIYEVFIQHEQTDYIDPKSNIILSNKLNKIFECTINQQLIDRILIYIDTMKYINVDSIAINVLSELKDRGFRLALVSNMMLPGKLLINKLKNAELYKYFEYIVVSSDIGYMKPHPTIFKKALLNLKLNKNNAVYVGDTYKQDIIGAKNVGMKAIWLNNQNASFPKDFNKIHDYEIHNLAELMNISILRKTIAG